MNEFRLYIVGRDKENEKAVRDIEGFLEEKLNDQFSLEVLDILDSPPQAIEDDIIITPTILRISPPPKRKVVGNIKAKEIIFQLLMD